MKDCRGSEQKDFISHLIACSLSQRGEGESKEIVKVQRELKAEIEAEHVFLFAAPVFSPFLAVSTSPGTWTSLLITPGRHCVGLQQIRVGLSNQPTCLFHMACKLRMVFILSNVWKKSRGIIFNGL